MRPSDFIRTGIINLSRRRVRTSLTALSMAIGVMCILMLVSVGIGYEQAYRESIEAMGSLTKIDVTQKNGSNGKIAILNKKAVAAFKGIDGVEAVTPVLQSTAYLKSGKYITMVKLYGIDMDTAASFGIAPIEGELPKKGETLRRVLVTPKTVVLRTGDLVQRGDEAPYTVRQVMDLEFYKNEYVLERQEDV